ncbi:hypothetical protein CC80DRAFT_527785 [Byssothecium circinans]|uniref:Inner centromere protein ARK-binding domain-containing protein n=1 Tax=Byssothecium circinans TaxID=147558 RepID=A0A6A5TKN5_9PLEO|nr:hypothetical protein CC80DRAFT_527785 [Byssothecium circinans]
MATRTKAPAIGSARWILDERHQSNDLVSQELEDFGFSVRNELEWLNEHMTDIFAQNGQNNLDVFKTPGKLRGKTPRTALKRAAEPRQPLADLSTVNSQRRPSLAEQSLKGNLQKNGKARFQIAEDRENVAPAKSPSVKSPVPQALFSALLGKGKENANSGNGYTSQPASPERRPGTGHSTIPVQFSPPAHSTQDTVMTGQDDDIFSQPQTQSTQPTQPTQSFGRSINLSDEERRETGDSFVSAKEAFASKNASKEHLSAYPDGDAMDVDEDKPNVTQSSAQDTVIRHELSSSSAQDNSASHPDIAEFPQPPRIVSDGYSISAETHEALDTAHTRANAPEPKSLVASTDLPAAPAHAVSEDDAQQDDTVVHHDIDDQMDIDEDVRSPSDGSSPVKPLVRKSSLTFAALPARQPLIAKKSMGDRVSRTSHIDQNKARASNLGRYTGGKSLGGSQLQAAEPQHDDHMDVDEERPDLRREESETTKMHNKTSSQRLLERINMLKQQNEAPKRITQNITSQTTQAQSFTSSQQSQPKEGTQPSQASQPEPQPEPTAPVSQPAYPSLAATEPEKVFEDDDDDWISPIRTTAAVPAAARPPFSKSHSASTRPVPAPIAVPKPISVSNPTDLSTVVESTTPAGSPTGKKYMDGPLSASKAKFYSALRAAKEKIIGSSAASAQVKLDALSDSPVRPKMKAHDSSDDIFSSPKRNEKAGTSIFSHIRSPSKESLKSSKSKTAAMPGSPTKDDGRRTRSSSERERQKEKEVREKEVKQKQRTEDKLKEMREKEQSKAAAQYQKSKAASSKTLAGMASQQSLKQAASVATKTPVANAQQSQSRPGMIRTNTADSAEDMPPPLPPKSFLPTTGHKLREPKKLVKAPSKADLAKSKPQKIMVPLNSSRYGHAPPPPSKHTTQPAPAAAAPVAPKPAAPAPKLVPASRPGTAASNRPPSAFSKSGPTAKPAASGYTKTTAPRMGRPQPSKAAEKPLEKPKAPTQTRADLAGARPIARMQTVQDVNRINVPPLNPVKPPVKRPFQPENDEPLHRPAKRPSQQAKMNPVTPAHAQFAKGKIPFAESAKSTQPTQPQYQDGNDIELPACVTDSEDDSDAEGDPFEQPSWVDTPNLHQLLTQQQLVDPETIFGPIAPLNMEQVFPDNKEKHKRFRQRTSSAYWANDQVTDEEKRKEREARERLVREGAWTYNPSPLAPPRSER